MAKKASNRSVYLPDELWAFLQAEAERVGISLNSVVYVAVRQLQAGQGGQPLAPGAGAAPRRAKPPSPEKKSPTPAASLVPTGRAKAAPGSRLKGAGNGGRRAR